MAKDPDGIFRACGCAFILISNGPVAVCITAKHVLAHASDVQRPWQLRNRNLPPGFDVGPTKTLHFDPRKLRAVWLRPDGTARALVIPYARLVGFCDLALFIVNFQQSDKDVFPRRHIAIDWRPPHVEDELWTMGFADVQHHSQSVDGQLSEFEFLLRAEVRRGTVSELDMGPGRLRQGPTFELSSPFPPGFSGAPVLNPMTSGEPLTLRGLVSSDSSSDAAFKSPDVAGAGRALMIWPLLGTSLPSVDVDGTEEHDVYLLDLLRRGVIKDLSGELDAVQLDTSGPSPVLSFRRDLDGRR